MTAEKANRLLARTINIGLHLNGPGDDGWCIHVTDKVWEEVKKAKFTAVRLCIQWAAHCQKQPPFAIDSAVFDKVDKAIADAKKHNLARILPLAYRTSRPQL